MFGYKSAGIVEEFASALPFVRTHSQGRKSATAIVPEMPGVTRNDETYIAATQFTVASMPFFRWSQ